MNYEDSENEDSSSESLKYGRANRLYNRESYSFGNSQPTEESSSEFDEEDLERIEWFIGLVANFNGILGELMEVIERIQDSGILSERQEPSDLTALNALLRSLRDGQADFERKMPDSDLYGTKNQAMHETFLKVLSNIKILTENAILLTESHASEDDSSARLTAIEALNALLADNTMKLETLRSLREWLENFLVELRKEQISMIQKNREKLRN